MLESSVIEGTNIVEATYDGSLSVEEVEQVQQQLATVAAASGQARYLAMIGDVDLGRIEPEAAWKDLKTIGELDKVDRIAVVTDTGWVEKIAGLAESFSSLELKVFEADKRDEALVWLRG